MCSSNNLILILNASLFYCCLHFLIPAATAAADHHHHHHHHHLLSINLNENNQNIISNAADSNSRGGRHAFTANHKQESNSNGSGSSFNSRFNDDKTIANFIDLTRKSKIHFNGFEIDENSLIDYLEEHEKELIFGKARKKRAVKLVHLNYRPDAIHLPAHQTASTALSRTKRSAVWSIPAPLPTTTTTIASPTSQRHRGNPETPLVSVQFKDNEHVVNMRLQQTPQLIDDAFVFIRRSANTSQLLEDSRQLAIKLEKCFYHNENSALDLCDKHHMRGVFHHNNTNFVIHPLPPRFGNSTHIILEADSQQYDNWWPNASSYLNAGLQFEPAEVEEDKEQHLSINKSRLTHSYAPLNLRYKPRYHRHTVKKQTKQHRGIVLNSRKRRHIIEMRSGPNRVPEVLNIETAVFVDSDLFKHMAKNFPKNTANHLIRFVLAMINGVQLLYHHASLGRRVNYVLKRLEILEKDPVDLRRSSDIDVYLSNFCKWQNSWNPPKDSDPFHYDHAVILTGLDLYVVGKNGKVISQVVGLAPVAGMCIPTSSCTINEGKHFESVFVVAHEIGHNLGMRHDAAEISCDPSLHIMSPTLGSGKTTWSKCSRDYLNAFLEKPQALCLFDHGKFTPNLDHGADGLLPGERFDADLQCMLKYGKDSVRARTQIKSDICRDLHCQRDRYTWTSHPALEGTFCGNNMWCRNGQCIAKYVENHTRPNSGVAKPLLNKASFMDTTKLASLAQETQKSLSSWSEWSEASQCDSGCLYGPSKRLGEGSTGLKTYSRKCLDHKRRCLGRDRKYESCVAKQCYKVPIITIDNFARRVCERAQKFNNELTGEGEQIVGNIEESCKIYCKTKNNDTKALRRLFPDGTACRSRFYGQEDPSYCIQGRCEKFSCDNATGNYYKIDPIHCKKSNGQLEREREDSRDHDQEAETVKHTNTYSNYIPTTVIKYKEHEDKFNKYPKVNSYEGDDERSKSDSGFYGPTTIRSKYENEVALRPHHSHSNNNNNNNNNNYKRKTHNQSIWNKYTYHLTDDYKSKETPPSPVAIRMPNNNEWLIKSGCYSSCMVRSKGAQVVVNKRTGDKNIQLCSTTVKPCERFHSTAEFADNTCTRYKQKVRGLSGHGTQIAASLENPDRSCRVGCQDEYIKHRFYLVNGKHGHFPLGTKCSPNEERYCVNGKCLEFGADNIPLQQSHISFALSSRNRRSLKKRNHTRKKRSFLYFEPVNITETLTQDFINGIVNSIITNEEQPVKDETLSDDHIEFTEPIYYSMDELIDK